MTNCRGIAFEWQSLGGSTVKAPMALELVGRNPTDRKKGSKRSLLVSKKGVPLAMVLEGANTHDVKLVAATLDGIVVGRSREGRPHHNLCLAAEYVANRLSA